ncbi:MAG: AbrB/MazE/SpoVT family DNA-binding domain-containing protein [Nitrospirota bacterium]
MAGRRTIKTRLIKPLAKGQITLPVAVRRQLGINEETLLRVSVKAGKIEIVPVRPVEGVAEMRDYTKAQIARFLAEDRIDSRTAARVRRLLGKRSAA